MADTIREQIISSFFDRLSVITTANGYNYNTGNNTYRAIRDINRSNVPAIVLWPQEEEVTQIPGYNNCVMNMKVEAINTFGSVNPSVVQEKMLGDIIKCFTDTSVVISSLIEEVFYIGGGPIAFPGAEDTAVGIVANFEINYMYDLGDPYTQT